MRKKLAKPKLIVILGPTASGKSRLAVKLAKKFRGEIVSADSRQVYRGMDIGTGKITKKETKGIPHYLLDVVSPKRRFTVVQYRKLALQAIKKILKAGKVPILCGGTGFYIQTVVDGILIPEVPPDWKLRKKLAKKSPKELFDLLKKLDPQRARTIEKKNPRRLIRALEIVIKTKKPVPKIKKKPQFACPPACGSRRVGEVLMLGLKKSPKELKELIKKRLLKWLKLGLIKEVKKLRKSGLSWNRIREFGMEYPYVVQYIQGKLDYNKMVELSQREIERYAKRQMTWFKRDKRIYWVKNYKEGEKLVRKFLKNRERANGKRVRDRW